MNCQRKESYISFFYHKLHIKRINRIRTKNAKTNSNLKFIDVSRETNPQNSTNLKQKNIWKLKQVNCKKH